MRAVCARASGILSALKRGFSKQYARDAHARVRTFICGFHGFDVRNAEQGNLAR
jgi:hypothetical protein